jgi:hypothetical protein
MSLQKLPEEVLQIIATYLKENSRDVINFSHICRGAYWACDKLLSDPGGNFFNILRATHVPVDLC